MSKFPNRLWMLHFERWPHDHKGHADQKSVAEKSSQYSFFTNDRPFTKTVRASFSLLVKAALLTVAMHNWIAISSAGKCLFLNALRHKTARSTCKTFNGVLLFPPPYRQRINGSCSQSNIEWWSTKRTWVCVCVCVMFCKVPTGASPALSCACLLAPSLPAMENERDDRRLKETYELAWTAQKCKPKRASVSLRRHPFHYQQPPPTPQS